MLGWMKAPKQRVEELDKENKKLHRDIAQLQRAHEQLRRQNEAEIGRLERERKKLQQEVERLKQELEQARRAGKRQAAPFSKGEPKAKPKRPGRKAGPGYGRHGYRAVPSKVDETLIVPLPKSCPDCGGSCTHQEWADQYQTEIVRQTRVTRFRVAVGRCRDCGNRVQGRHPLQTSDALGAAASQLGPEAVSLATVLNKQLGLPFGKTAAVLEQGFGLKVTRGALSQAMARVGSRCEPTYEGLIGQIRTSPAVTVDETGWKVGGRLQWLWAHVTEDRTVYAILPGRGYPEAAVVLGEDFDGWLVHDGWRPYYRFRKAIHQSCQQHLIRRCQEMAELGSPAAAVFPLRVKALLLDGLALRDRHQAGEISDHGLAVATGRLETRLQQWLIRPYRNPHNQRLAKHLIHEYDHLFTYLKFPGLEATNWRGEQAIRPAVVARKVWGGNRTEAGARTQGILMSFLRTCHQRAREALPLLTQLLRSPRPQVVDFSGSAPLSH
jgi:transposase